ncbi:MAG TPA: TIGR01777 family oxidoreductase [Bacteroidota bacterium]|nr:TIGR01777 family oxidoreductase [Bacteroidota bacterium]
MNILITGSHGFIASALIPWMSAGGHNVFRLVREPVSNEREEFRWDPYKRELNPEVFNGKDAVIHLAGESIAVGRWTESKKKNIRESRVIPTRFLAETLSMCSRPPGILICASAIGYYGDRGAEMLTEESPPGDDFLATVCREWETATAPAAGKGIRVVHLRFGLILSPRGGALQKLLVPFRFGVGGMLGSGKQYWSWIAIDDVVGAIMHALVNEKVRGPVNLVTPDAITNKEFTRTLGKVLSRPTFLPAPAFALRLALGEMADALLLSSARIEPRKLIATGFHFKYTRLEAALQSLLKR